MAVYFIRSGERGPVKIGYSGNVANRFRKIASDCPPPAELLACIADGGFDLEQELHARFADHRIGREWFRPHPDVLAFAAQYTADVPKPRRAGPQWDNPLGHWLYETDTRRDKFAESIGCSLATLSRILCEVDRPGWDLLAKIAEVTAGRVMPNDFLHLKAS